MINRLGLGLTIAKSLISLLAVRDFNPATSPTTAHGQSSPVASRFRKRFRGTGGPWII